MKIFTHYLLLVLLATFTLTGCDLFEVEDRADPNGPSVNDILANPTRDALINLAAGVEASARVDHNLYLIDVGVIGREYWRTLAADPRFTGDLLGRETSILDNNSFYITRPWGARYVTIRNANIMLQALDLNATLSDAEKAGGRGFAKTFKALQYLLNLNLTFQNGIRFIGPGDDDPGPLVDYNSSLMNIASLLDEGAADLAAGGDEFFFPLSSGFAGFDTPAGLRMVNRGLAARVALYAGRNGDALTILGDSFLDDGDALSAGVNQVFSTGSGDITNPIFTPPNNPVGDAILAHPSYMDDIEAGDTRADKVFDRGEPATFDGLTSSFGFFVYKNSLSPISIVRNAELILIRAEARARTGDLLGAISDIDVIRTAAGLPEYSGAVEEGAVLDEVLNQRRYELYGEGHRWIDVRRFNQLNTLPIDRAGDDVWTEFPIPLNEGV
ncbi:MAG: RagB/SusD family nutrient uptake outer membrane protein [Rubricoccaceae bacterium]|nr:RagB/SusD family nutrient uptake outer membrane protein [Rubricoccaceae bacterium]